MVTFLPLKTSVITGNKTPEVMLGFRRIFVNISSEAPMLDTAVNWRYYLHFAMKDVDKLKITENAGSITISVKAVPGASRDKIVSVLGDRLKIAVSAPPEKGKANKAIAKLLAKSFSLSNSDVKLVSAPANPSKEFQLNRLDKNTLVELLGKL